jgi:hypothetical protein
VLAEAECRSGNALACDRWALSGGADLELAKKACSSYNAVEPCVIVANSFPPNANALMIRACERGSYRACVDGLPLSLADPASTSAAIRVARKVCLEREGAPARAGCAIVVQTGDTTIPREKLEQRISELGGLPSSGGF